MQYTNQALYFVGVNTWTVVRGDDMAELEQEDLLYLKNESNLF